MSGIVDAESEKAAKAKLRKDGKFPTSLTQAEEGKLTRGKGLSMEIDLRVLMGRVKTRDLAIATRQFSTLIGSGIPMDSSLQALAKQVDSPVLTKVFSQIRERVTQGTSLANALKEFPKYFSALFVNMVNAGEQSRNARHGPYAARRFHRGHARPRTEDQGRAHLSDFHDHHRLGHHVLPCRVRHSENHADLRRHEQGAATHDHGAARLCQSRARLLVARGHPRRARLLRLSPLARHAERTEPLRRFRPTHARRRTAGPQDRGQPLHAHARHPAAQRSAHHRVDEYRQERRDERHHRKRRSNRRRTTSAKGSRLPSRWRSRASFRRW
ncbi:MAG: type II secretion system F family protein [Deltaproteobacteria bacterium]|nr:type II secretion system F family protein [Deltaproteobacteria bacterium]